MSRCWVSEQDKACRVWPCSKPAEGLPGASGKALGTLQR
jgi:hypothetical protein